MVIIKWFLFNVVGIIVMFVEYSLCKYFNIPDYYVGHIVGATMIGLAWIYSLTV